MPKNRIGALAGQHECAFCLTDDLARRSNQRTRSKLYQTPTLPENFHLDGPEAMGWSDVEVEGSSPGSMFNPNEMHPDFNDQHGHRGC